MEGRVINIILSYFIERGENMIEFTRGDTFAFKTQITYADGSPIKIEDIKSIYITSRVFPTKESPVIFQKTLEDISIDNEGFCHVVFLPIDTEKLDYREYYFDIEITLNSGFKKTKLYKFKLTEETTIFEGDLNGN